MTFFTQEPTGISRLEDLDAPFGEVISANARRAWLTNPMPSAGRAMDLAGASSGYANDLSSGEFGLPVAVDEQQLSQNIPAVDARRRLQEEQLDTHLKIPETGIRKDALDIIIARKKEELALKSVIDRSPGGVVLGAANILTGLAVSLLDPINVASGFIPVIGPERYAALLANAGANAAARAGVRAGVGAAEGVVGSAIVEPIVLGAAMQEQADYGIADSLLNVAFGGVLGGGMHAGIGRYADWRNGVGRQEVARVPEILQGASLETRQALARTAIADFAQGRMPDVEALARLDPHVDRLMSSTSMTRVGDDGLAAYLRSATNSVAEARNVASGLEFSARELAQRVEQRARTLDPATFAKVDALESDIASFRSQLAELKTAKEAGAPAPAMTLTDQRIKELETQLASFTGKRKKSPRANELRAEIENLKGSVESVARNQEGIAASRETALRLSLNEKVNERAKLGPDVNKAMTQARNEAAAIGISERDFDPTTKMPLTPDNLLRVSQNPVDPVPPEIARSIAVSRHMENIREQARARYANMIPANEPKANPEIQAKLQAAERQNAMPDEAAKAEMDSAVVDLQEFAKARGLDDLAARELKAADAIIAEGDTYAKAAQAMVNCQLRRA